MYKTILKSMGLCLLFVFTISVSSCSSDYDEPLTSSTLEGETNIPRLRTIGETYTKTSYDNTVEILLDSFQLECVCGTSVKTHKKLTIHANWTWHYSDATFLPIFRFEVPQGCTCRNSHDFRTGTDLIAETNTYKTYRSRNLVIMATSIASKTKEDGTLEVKRSTIGERFYTTTMRVNLHNYQKYLTSTETESWGQPQ